MTSGPQNWLVVVCLGNCVYSLDGSSTKESSKVIWGSAADISLKMYEFFAPLILKFRSSSFRDASSSIISQKAPSRMSSTGTYFGSSVTTTLSADLSSYIRREKLISRLREIFGRKIEVEVSLQSLSSSLVEARCNKFVLVSSGSIFFPSSKRDRRGIFKFLPWTRVCSSSFTVSDFSFFSSSMK